MIAHWPEVIEQGKISGHVGHIIDFMPTFIDLAGGTYPENLDGNMLTPLEGISLFPVFRGEPQKEHDALYWEHLGYRAVRQGKWKLVSDEGDWKLYDLENDRTELNNLAVQFPERAVEMSRMWEEWAMRSNVK